MTLMMNWNMRYSLAVAGAVAVLVSAHPAAADVWLAEGYEVESYGHVAMLPGAIDFDNAGALFLGNEEGDDKFDVPIYKIEPGGGEGAPFGDPLPDPDAVVVDKDGAFNGTPGAVLVGGNDFHSGKGYVAYILPDGTNTDMWPGLIDPPDNIGRMRFDTNDRLLLTGGGPAGIYWSPNPDQEPLPLIPGYQDGPQTVATDAMDRIYTSSSEGTVSFYESIGDVGEVIELNFVTDLGFITELVIGPGADWGTDLYAGNTDGELYRIHACGRVTLIGSGFNRIASIAFGPEHALYIAEYDTDDTGNILKLTITTPPSCPCPWDFDGDGNVGATDLLSLLVNWGPCP